MIFSPKSLRVENNVQISGINIDQVSKTKFLGVIIDSKLTWKDHINFIKTKISKGIGILYRARKFLNEQSLKTLYYSFIYPYFSYCIELWGFTFKSYIEPLFLLQKRIIRIKTSSKFLDHSEPLYNKLEILSLSKLCIFRTSMFLYKYENNDLPAFCFTMFRRNSDVHTYRTRHSNNLRMHSIIRKYEALIQIQLC